MAEGAEEKGGMSLGWIHRRWLRGLVSQTRKGRDVAVQSILDIMMPDEEDTSVQPLKRLKSEELCINRFLFSLSHKADLSTDTL